MGNFFKNLSRINMELTKFFIFPVFFKLIFYHVYLSLFNLFESWPLLFNLIFYVRGYLDLIIKL